MFNQFRLGTWPKLFPGVQFSDQPEVLDQFFRSMTPNTGPYDANVISDSMSALFDRIGDGILFTHLQGGGPGWLTAIKNPRVKGVVSFEPGSGFVFPEGEVPPPIRDAFDTVAGGPIPMAQFSALTKIPIVIYYGDNIPSEPTDMPAQDSCEPAQMARLWRDAVNRRGGDVTVVHLPERGIRGDARFPFSDLNNVQVADEVSRFLSEKASTAGGPRQPHEDDGQERRLHADLDVPDSLGDCDIGGRGGGPRPCGPRRDRGLPGRFARLIPGVAEQLRREGPRQAAILHDPSRAATSPIGEPPALARRRYRCSTTAC